MKTLPEWIRYFPHPSYGKYCGMWNCHKRDEGLKPVDELDAACQLHDWTEDDVLFSDLLREDLKVNSWYGRIYLFFCRLIFRGNNK